MQGVVSMGLFVLAGAEKGTDPDSAAEAAGAAAGKEAE